MKILVLGASGQLGHLLVQVGERRGLTVLGTYRSHPRAGLLQLDLLDFEATRHTIQHIRPDWVVNCASWTWVDGNEDDPQRAQRENVDTVAVAAAAVTESDARWCYLSSSYVFDGTSGRPYTEEDTMSPISVYARTKVQSEEISRTYFGSDALIVRTIVVWGPDPQEKNFAYQVIGSALSGKPMEVPVDQLGNPTYGPDLASALIQLLERGAGGTWNVAGPEEHMDRVSLARLFCRTLDLDDGFIRPVTTAELAQPARRPLNASLATGKLADAGLALRPTADALAAWRAGEWEWPWQDR
ncbi:MAG TPA: SDR family oxidoreductase [Gemmatimonadota bacterium]|nr:SDR family oxidoreductase [Gemmatimonadota bacterium]